MINVVTGVQVTTVDENNFQLFAHNQQAMDEAKEMIEQFLKDEVIPQCLPYISK